MCDHKILITAVLRIKRKVSKKRNNSLPYYNLHEMTYAVPNFCFNTKNIREYLSPALKKQMSNGSLQDSEIDEAHHLNELKISSKNRSRSGNMLTSLLSA